MKDIKKFEQTLKDLKFSALPFATKETMNQAVFKGQQLARTEVRNKMVLRNKFSISSIQFRKTQTLKLANQTASFGSTAKYMSDQEFGATKRKMGKHGVVLPTGYSAGQEGKQPRTKLPRKPNKLQNIRITKERKKGQTRKLRNFIAVKQAVKKRRKFVFLDLGRKKGLFRIAGGKRNPKIKMVHDLSLKSVSIPANPWLNPAVNKLIPLVPAMYKKALLFQLKRLGAK